MIFNKSVKTKKEFIKIRDKIRDKIATKEEFIKIRDKIANKLTYYKHPKQLSKQDIAWLKKNVKQFDKKVLDKIIKDSILPNHPK